MDVHSLECLDFCRVRTILASYAATGLGKALAETVRPNVRLELVERWLRQVRDLQRLCELRGMPPFGGVTDVRGIVRNCAPPLRVSVEDMARVGDALAGTQGLAQYFADLPEELAELGHLARRIGNFESIAARIRAVIDERGAVRDDASPKLRDIRRRVEQAADRIRETVDRLLHDQGVRRLLQYANYTYHNDRLVLPLKIEHRGRLPGIIHRTSDSGATVYVEPANAVELNNQITDLRSEERAEIDRLLWELAHEVHLNEQPILKTLDTLAVVDLISAKVRMARDFDMRCPELNDAGTLRVRGARHPLLLDMARQARDAGQTPMEVVPIDYRLGDDFDMLLVTGPNTGGKTVTLKTVGLLSLMVQAGLPAPVDEGSSFGVFVNVLIDVGDEQSLQQSLSTFSGHLKRLMDMLRRADRRTLVLSDELGAGTDPDEGAAIGRAILDELLRLECRCIVTTHLGALKGFALTRDRAENACVEFDLETLRPTYHLRIGEPGESNAIAIAKRLGMPRRLIIAARRNLSKRGRALRAALAGTVTSKREAEKARDAAEAARRDADRAASEAGAAKARLAQQQADFEHWVRRVVHLQPGDAVRVRNFDRDGRIVRVRLDQQRAEVDVGAFAVDVPLGDVLPPETPPPPAPLEPQRAAPQRAAAQPRRSARTAPRPDGAPRQTPRQPPDAEARAKPHIPSLTSEQADGLKPGDVVYVKRFHREGAVVRTKTTKRIALVSVGVLEVEVPFDGLALPHGNPRPAGQGKGRRATARAPHEDRKKSGAAASAGGNNEPARRESGAAVGREKSPPGSAEAGDATPAPAAVPSADSSATPADERGAAEAAGA